MATLYQKIKNILILIIIVPPLLLYGLAHHIITKKILKEK